MFLPLIYMLNTYIIKIFAIHYNARVQEKLSFDSLPLSYCSSLSSFSHFVCLYLDSDSQAPSLLSFVKNQPFLPGWTARQMILSVVQGRG